MKKIHYHYQPETRLTSRNAKVLIPVQPLVKEKKAIPPSEEKIAHLNAMAGQYPFCVNHKARNINLL